jgi:hypothetical protein
MNRALPWIVVAVVLAAAGGWYWWQQQTVSPPPVTPAPRAEAPVAPVPEAPSEPPRHPIEQAKPDVPPAREAVPGLAESDQLIRDMLLGALGSDAVISFFNVDGYIRRTVATVDNLPRPRAAARLWPVTPMAGPLTVVSGADGAATIDAANVERYARFVSLVQGMDTGKFVAMYVRLYPHFQQAYADLGYPNRYFNDRLVEVIDHLLAAPEVQGPIALKKPWILWEYADPKLESLSAGQKTLVRVGPDNAAKLKAKLRDIRRQVAAADVKG